MNILTKTAVAFAMAVAAISSAAGATPRAEAQCPSAYSQTAECSAREEADNGIFDLLSPELIKVYEDNVAHTPVVSDISPAKLKRMAEKYGCGEKKMCALIVVRDMAARVGGSVTLAELSGESDLALIKRAKQYADIYSATLTDDEKRDLENKFKGAFKGNSSLPFLK